MHMSIRLIPRNHIPRSMCTENRIRSVNGIALRVIPGSFYYFRFIMTIIVSVKYKFYLTLAVCIRHEYRGVFHQPGHRRPSAQYRYCTVIFHRLCHAAHLHYIGHCPSYAFIRKFHPESVIRFKQSALCLHQPLSYGAIHSLSEISAFGMLNVSSSRNERYLNIGYGSPCKDTFVPAFCKMSENKPLPVTGQNFLTAFSIKNHAASACTRFKP